MTTFLIIVTIGLGLLFATILGGVIVAHSESRKNRKFLHLVNTSPEARIVFDYPKEITTSGEKDILLVHGAAHVALTDSRGRNWSKVLYDSEFRLPVTHFTHVNEIAIPELLVFGAKRVSCELRAGDIYATSVEFKS